MRDFDHPAVFGDLEDILARQHEIVGRHRTKFQARLKNFHRLGWPDDFTSIKGKASTYDPGSVVDMALALELTQLGLAPERVVHVLRQNRWATLMAYRMAATAIASVSIDELDRRRPLADPIATFVFFDPAALSSLTVVSESMDEVAAASAASFFYGGINVIRDNLSNWNITEITRMSVVNITALMDQTAWMPLSWNDPEAGRYRREYFEWIADWASTGVANLQRRVEAEEQYASKLIFNHDIRDSTHLADVMGIKIEAAEQHMKKFGLLSPGGQDPANG